ncbi:MAG: hypothetical protein AMS24_01465 [Chlamydiae bacterium SM23_39]|nr:MAG: hypothetical protein AMS24_01465 [Chlamydiae bacterium SM23_39]
MLQKFNRIKSLITKEFYQIIRDPSSILIAFIFPMILLFIYGVGVSLDMDNLKIGLVLEDTNPDAQSFSLSLKNSKFFSVEVARNKQKLQKKLIAGNIRGLVILPFYFSEFKSRPDKQGPIYVISDGSEPNTANFVQNYLQGAWLNWMTQENISNGEKTIKINVQPRFWFNEELDSRHFLIPGSIAIIMTLIGTLLTALVIAREWERGTMEALMATPVTMREIYIAKMISYFCLGIGSMLICTFFAVFFYGVPFRGSIFALTIISSTFLLTALGTGLLISSAARNQFLASQISIITAFLPAFMLSGFVFEISSMPLFIQILSYLIPARYMVSSLQTLFLVGDVWRLLIFNISIMLIVVLILFSIIFSKSIKRLD